jgi:hypothetical protein
VLAGMLVIRQYPRRRAALVPGFLLLLLACYTKQQAVVLVPAAFFHVWQQSRRTALICLGGFAAAGLAALAGLQAWSGGSYWQNTVTAQTTDFEFGVIIPRAEDFVSRHAVLIAGAIGWIVFQANRRRLDIWSVFALSTIVLVIFMGKGGAGFHYCLPAIVAAAICMALAIERLWRALPPDWRAGGALQVMVLLLILQGVIFWIEPAEGPTTEDRRASDRILDLVRQTKGDVLTERRVMFSVLAGRRPQADFCLLSFIYDQDMKRAKTASPPGTYRPRWDPLPMVQAIREKRYPLIVVEPRLIPPEVFSEIATGYQRLGDAPVSIGNWHGANSYQLAVPK